MPMIDIQQSAFIARSVGVVAIASGFALGMYGLDHPDSLRPDPDHCWQQDPADLPVGSVRLVAVRRDARSAVGLQPTELTFLGEQHRCSPRAHPFGPVVHSSIQPRWRR